MEHTPFYTKIAQSVLKVKAVKHMIKTGETFEQSLAAVRAEQQSNG